MGIEPFLSASAVNCVLAQRLARRLCPECKEAYTPDGGGARARSGSRSSRASCRRCTGRVGCKKCNGIGYKGRMGIHEVMTMTETLERLTVEHASADELDAAGGRARAC